VTISHRGGAAEPRRATAATGPSPCRSDGTFWRWHDRWTDPAFRSWNIEALLPDIAALLASGEDDEYATMAQLDGIKRLVPQAELLKLAGCHHAPHRDQPQAVTDAVIRFICHAAP
jgi:pimeloyl-ACP methyl ester carboxylesterase